MTRATAVFSSRLAPALARYVDLKRALGLHFRNPTRTLGSLDRFLNGHITNYPDLNAAAFQAWCQTQGHLSSGVQRERMRQIYNFCLYRRRTEPRCFVPDPTLFPKPHQRLRPYIFSGELLRLTRGDYDCRNATLRIRESKFHKSRLLPLNDDIAGEIEHYLRAQARRKLPLSSETALIWNGRKGGRAYSARGLQRSLRLLLQQCSIFTPKGRLPRIHDFRHAHAVNALLRWYRAGAEVEAKLPLLATYMGHVSVMSTHYYLHWIEPLRTAASERFAHHYGKLVVPALGRQRWQR